MDTKAAIVALMTVWGVGTCVSVPVGAEEGEDRANPLLNKVWVRADADPVLPGPMQIFLADGTPIEPERPPPDLRSLRVT